jgi:hypothetical protein
MSVHFHHYLQGAPAPGVCQKCGNNQDIFDLGVEAYDGNALICRRCIRDLATFIGWVEEAPLRAEIVSRETTIKNLEEQLAKVPNNVEELINGIRSSVTDFVFAVSYSDSISDSEAAEKPKLPVEQPGQYAQRPKSDASPHSKPARK